MITIAAALAAAGTANPALSEPCRMSTLVMAQNEFGHVMVAIGQSAKPSKRVFIDLKTDPLARQLLDSSRILQLTGQRLMLRFEGVRIAGQGTTGFRVFANLPDANYATPAENGLFLTSRAFFPIPKNLANAVEVGSFVIPIGKILAERVASQILDVTGNVNLVLTPIGNENSRIGFETSALYLAQ